MGRLLKVRNPRTGENDYQIEAQDAEEVAATAARLRANQRQWRDGGLEYRAEILRRWADAADARGDAIAEALILDTGRATLSRSEAHGVGAKIRRWCNDAPALMETRESTSKIAPAVAFRQQLVPYDLVGVISPWNFPLSLALIDALPALVAGCAVMIKPSEVTPRFMEPLAESIAAVPELAGVLALVPGDGATGAAVIGEADMVCFTGSVPTGRKVAEAAAKRFIPAFLELGGKDPAIVLSGADLERAADAILRQGLVNSGQVCLSLERVYAQADIFDAFVDILVEKARAITPNLDSLEAGHLGPIISGPQADIIEAQLRDAYAKGAIARLGGEVIRKGGNWLGPTILTNVDHGMEIMREETFGPVIPVMPFKDADEAVALANDTVFGLSAAVFAKDTAAALAVASRVDAGGVSVNDAGLQSMTTEAEKNSFKYSGLGGSRMGGAGLMRFFRKKALMIQNGAPRTMSAFEERPVQAGAPNA
ncbi:MAG TPA: aldehyde dehydrogenase family protein [Terricaulis sp.]|nr:aldehyde dehydrogenase family protein [Terricaulis sp.]